MHSEEEIETERHLKKYLLKIRPAAKNRVRLGRNTRVRAFEETTSGKTATEQAEEARKLVVPAFSGKMIWLYQAPSLIT